MMTLRTHSIVHFGQRQVAVNIPQLAVCCAIAVFALWLLWSAWSSAADVENLILILPVSVLAFMLFPFVVAGAFRGVAADDDGVLAATPARAPLGRGTTVRIGAAMALLLATAIVGSLAGFDIALVAYVAAMMALLGERRPLVLVLVPLIFTGLVIYVFNVLLAAPLPLLLLHGIGS